MAKTIDCNGKAGPHTDLGAVLGAVVCGRREGKGVTQAALADAIGLTACTLSRMERGSSAITLESLDAVARELGARPSELLAEAERLLGELGERGVAVLPPGARPGPGYLNARRLEGALAVIEPLRLREDGVARLAPLG